MNNFVAGHGWPGLSTRPITDESWEGARTQFCAAFMGALQAGVYPKKLIIKEITVQAVRSAFDASVSFQIETQMGRNAFSNRSLLEFAGRAAVGILHRQHLLGAHRCIAEMAHGLWFGQGG